MSYYIYPLNYVFYFAVYIIKSCLLKRISVAKSRI